MQREFLNPEGMATPPSNLYNHVVKVGNTVYIAGQLSRDENGNAIHVGDAEAQTVQAWKNLETAIKSVGGTLADIVKTNTYVVGSENLAKVRAARLNILPPEGRPYQHYRSGGGIGRSRLGGGGGGYRGAWLRPV